MVHTVSLTVARAATAELEIKRSRFRADVVRAATEDEARALVERLRREHWDARHHCSAFVLGPDQPGGEIQRSSDDGEPAGTAGAPMLEVLRGRELVDVAVVVTRWFGGVLLGAGGLVRAYGDAVRAVCDEAGVQRRELRRTGSLTVGHADAGRAENDLRARGVVVTGTTYGATGVELALAAPAEGTAEVDAAVAAATAGAAEVTWGDTGWVDV
ncbi:IMPACT family protein [Nocardioides massiliensis]|uniref:IMPACT family protein n=1 Tax=Nocardioides massiliensis TaxID=1325935 RepID=UPI0008324157|nr:YigZ family protein [Nocardioides massiliensis]